MITTFVVLAVLLTLSAAALTYAQRRTPAGCRTPVQRLVDWLGRTPDRPYGPDTERVAAELSILTRRYDKLI
ncbi:hypothetical protein O4159_03610 [Gordonia terrae]|uniref:hypothetical protein n=1 Tax=Gordonia hongkongensis TaxID=1701090 RepID=UPI0022B49A2F|nr:hypothetical protein [Gordonia terrae]